MSSRLEAILFASISLVAACVSASEPSRPSQHTPQCLDLEARRVEALAWAPSGDQLFVITQLNDMSYAISRLSRVGALEVDATVQIESPDPFVTVDRDGVAYWMYEWTDTVHPDATAEWSFGISRWDGETVSRVGDLPSPRFSRLTWTDLGMFAAEYTAPDIDPSVLVESTRTVRLDIGRSPIEVSPLGPWDSTMIGFGVSTDGATRVTGRESDLDDTILAVGDLQGHLTVERGVARLDVAPGVGLVGYQMYGDGYDVWDVASGRTWRASEARIYTSALSDTGLLAFADSTDTGPEGRVCVLDAVASTGESGHL